MEKYKKKLLLCLGYALLLLLIMGNFTHAISQGNNIGKFQICTVDGVENELWVINTTNGKIYRMKQKGKKIWHIAYGQVPPVSVSENIPEEVESFDIKQK